MFQVSREIVLLLAAALASLGLAPLGATDPALGNTCTLEYQRADNMWRAEPNLGWETVTVSAGSSKKFITDWAYEKLRNDGTRYYGSHLRIATNKGTRRVLVETWSQLGLTAVFVKPGETRTFRQDLALVWCE